ncbi:alpha/beta hydrolase family protein [Calycomorphotria hydatis]|uniref:Alpha/beta hydrolase family protein n=1 Tax=Calycomorphotria hydatis TaxID=2528027 RepID=A0A517T4G4_9PLAN|nr:dienelactone hydrolase [Calycomorphotria hydatis]QDT63269.1 Alpha/beta hydrolase family protein [Calycomorphotria hydatis]
MNYLSTFSVLALLLCQSSSVSAQTYDPLKIAAELNIQTIDRTIVDEDRDREIPVRIYVSDDTSRQAKPVVLFSHGLGGSCRNNPYLGNHWASRGYVSVFMQHHGSDESVWKDAPAFQRFRSLKQAASGKNWQLRVKDVPKVIDQLTVWNADSEDALYDALDLTKIGMSGHSFGAITTQAVSGQTFGPLGQYATDSRIDAAVAFSPSTPRVGDADKAFGNVCVPWMLMTGTKDVAMIGGADVESRLGVYPALPASIDRYEIVLFDAEHLAFSDVETRRATTPRNPNHHRLILALSTAFWDTYLKENHAAEAWLKGDGPNGLLEKDDRWQLAEGNQK